MWGEHSQQYAACRQVAEAYLIANDADVNATSDVEELMGKMGMLAVGDGVAGAGKGV